MSRLQRKLLINSLALGFALTLLVMALESFGALRQAEVWLYDRRARTCQHFVPPPTAQLVHLDIDDNSLDVIGRWPWSRATLAEMLDEIHLAGPKAVEMDFIFPDREPSTWVRQADGSMRELRSDDLMAAAIGRAGNIILAASFDVPPATSPLYQRMVDELTKNPRLSREQIVHALGAKDADVPAVATRYNPARQQAVHDRIAKDLAAGANHDAIRKSLLGEGADDDLVTALGRIIDEQMEFVLAERTLRRFGAPAPPNFPKVAQWRAARAPIHEYSEQAAGIAFVEYPYFEDGIIRSVPMLLESDGLVYGQMGLVLACRMLGTPLDKVRVEGNRVVVPRAGSPDVRIPVTRSRTDSKGNRIALLMDLPWFGTREWLYMYDFPSHTQPKQHLSPLTVWNALTTRKKIAHNAAVGDPSLLFLLGAFDKKKFNALENRMPTDPGARLKLFTATIDDLRAILEPVLAQTDASQLSEDERKQSASLRALENIVKEDNRLRSQLRELESELSNALKDRAVLVGFTATGSISDVVPTSLHDRCPGVIVHGVVFNGIMTGEMWKRTPGWVGIAIVLALGLLTAAATGWLSPIYAAIVAILLALGYALINGYLLFDYANLIVPAAGPLLAVMLVWGGCAVWRAFVESNERRRITARFQNYIEPELVNYYLDHPEELGLKGKMREMTVVFTDLAGFTSVSEKLGAQVVEMLNEFMGLMVPVIRAHHGYVNKFLGDGIMFFFGAPADSVKHASHSVNALLDMQAVVADFSKRLQARGLPPVLMRAGVVSGDMVVGDAGSDEKRDYTVIGDAVNLASRMEGANKATGTLTLISQRTAELIGVEYLLRPVGTLQVVGKTEGVRAFEVIAPMSRATGQQKALVAITSQMIDAFTAGRFADCLECCARMDARFGASKLADMYRALCVEYLRDPPASFSGVIVLSEK